MIALNPKGAFVWLSLFAATTVYAVRMPMWHGIIAYVLLAALAAVLG